MEINRSNVIEIVKNAGLKPDKDYGQNFLIEPDVSKRIVEAANLEKNDKILEIGPGIGSLTHYISLSDAQISLVDIDRRMVDFLLIFYKDNNNIKIFENDIRKTPVGSYTKIIGNLPYNITTETVIYLLKEAKCAKKMILMCQTEAFNRFYDLSGGDYGPASVLVHLLGNSKKLFSVKPGCFYPAPKCGSTVFEINLNGQTNREKAIKVYELAKSLFLNRRKNILNNLSNYLKDRPLAETILTKSGIEVTKRPEEISPQQYEIIFDAVNIVK
ncbi:MAG: ribosomal RNA small subunit methyltransferase A [Bacilli bacterium]|nr:ribosomal RNA small subunit methyltransferase A [Bacilli bacterium]